VRPAVAWTLSLGAAATMLGVSGRFAVYARVDATRARNQLALLAEQARELISLRVASASQTSAKRQASGLAPRVGAALSRCGLPASCLSSLSPETAVVVNEGSSHLRRQRATLALGSITLPQLGSFLNGWRTSEPDWGVTSIDLSPMAAGQNASTGGDLPLRAVLVVESMYADQPEQAPVPVILKAGAATSPETGSPFIKQTGGTP
jgi:hypothetical protein